MTHFINLEEITKKFYEENQILKHGKEAISDLIERTEQQKKEMTEKIAEIESLYHLDHSHLTQFKQRLKSDLKYDMSNLIEFTKDSN